MRERKKERTICARERAPAVIRFQQHAKTQAWKESYYRFIDVINAYGRFVLYFHLHHTSTSSDS